ncbi:hypothetical protein AB9128_12260 [Streptomyces cinereoruber]|uniref:hypothetical protein n=1 Tax=Streptomyces cinereoruber TaxID=67260 RepID=UPI003EB828FD
MLRHSREPVPEHGPEPTGERSAQSSQTSSRLPSPVPTDRRDRWWSVVEFFPMANTSNAVDVPSDAERTARESTCRSPRAFQPAAQIPFGAVWAEELVCVR